MPIVNYAKLYRMVRLLIAISSLCSHHSCQVAAVKKTRVHADNLGKFFFYKFLGGVLIGFLLFLEKWGKCKYLHSQIVPLDISEDKKNCETGEGLLRTRISSY